MLLELSLMVILVISIGLIWFGVFENKIEAIIAGFVLFVIVLYIPFNIDEKEEKDAFKNVSYEELCEINDGEYIKLNDKKTCLINSKND